MIETRQLIFNVQPQTDGFYCIWAGAGDARVVRVEYREETATEWTRVPAGTSAGCFIAVGDTRSAYLIRPRLAQTGDAEQPREVARCRVRERDRLDWLPLPNRLPYSRIRYFNSWSRFSHHVARSIRNGSVTRLDGSSVTPSDPAMDNGFYRVGDSVTLLARALGRRLEPHPVNPPAAVRAFARRILWPAGYPFDTERLQPGLPRFEVPLSAALVSRHVAKGVVFECRPGIHSRIVQLLPPGGPTGKVAIYHEGHTGAAVDIGWETVNWLLERGWEVYCLDLPLCGLNEPDAAPGLATHNDLLHREAAWGYHPIALLVAPLLRLVDHVSRSRAQRGPVMVVGRSGGGMMAYLGAALDPRIDLVISVAGGVPLSQRLEKSARDVGDYEQYAPSFFDLIRHEDLMAAAAQGRLLMIYNGADPECFALEPEHAFFAYIRREAARFGGQVEIFVDAHHARHSIGAASYAALDRFLLECGRAGAGSETDPGAWT